MKNIFPNLIGNDKAKQILFGNLSHAFIIEGPEGSGKLTAARNAAAAALCGHRDRSGHPPCGVCPVCSKVFRGIHSDVIEFSVGPKKSIGVDTARVIRSQVFIAPGESEYKFFIIRGADLMTTEAQNALLISLEEPPAFAVFFLLVKDKSLLLETIRSRCTVLTMEKLDDGIISENLKAVPEGAHLSSADPDAFNSIVRGADGYLGRALTLLENKDESMEEARRNAAELVRTVLTGTPEQKVRLAAVFPRTREEQDKIYTLAVSAARDIIAMKLHTEASLLFYRDVEEAAALTSETLPKLMSFYSTLEDCRFSLYGNSSPALTAEQIIMRKL